MPRGLFVPRAGKEDGRKTRWQKAKQNAKKEAEKKEK